MRPIIQFAPARAATPDRPFPGHNGPAIRTDGVYVVYTSFDDTLAAVRAAGGFAKALSVPVTVVHFRTVPYALPVDAPVGVSPVETDAFLTCLRSEGLDVRVRVYLCRDGRRATPTAFKPRSLVVVAGRRRWWQTESERWRRALESAGHFVVFVDRSEPSAHAETPSDIRESSSAAA